MADYGIKVTRPGFDVATAADNQLLFSSSFPTLDVLFQFTIVSGGNATHGLGYEPVIMGIANEGAVAGTNITGFGDNVFTADTTKVYNTSGVTAIVYVYARPLRTSFTASNINLTPATQTTVSQDYGFKVSTNGNDVFSAILTNLITFSGLSSAGQSVRQVMIHQSGFQDNVSDGGTVTYSHNLGYIPLFLTYRKAHGASQYIFSYYKSGAAYNSANTFQASCDSSNLSITLNGVGAQDIAYVLFKDPF